VGGMMAGTSYALFRCKGRGLTMNADRKASVTLGVAVGVAVAAKSLLERGAFSLSIPGRPQNFRQEPAAAVKG